MNFQNWVTSSTGKPVNDRGGLCVMMGMLCDCIERPNGS